MHTHHIHRRVDSNTHWCSHTHTQIQRIFHKYKMRLVDKPKGLIIDSFKQWIMLQFKVKLRCFMVQITAVWYLVVPKRKTQILKLLLNTVVLHCLYKAHSLEPLEVLPRSTIYGSYPATSYEYSEEKRCSSSDWGVYTAWFLHCLTFMRPAVLFTVLIQAQHRGGARRGSAVVQAGGFIQPCFQIILLHWQPYFHVRF